MEKCTVCDGDNSEWSRLLSCPYCDRIQPVDYMSVKSVMKCHWCELGFEVVHRHVIEYKTDKIGPD